MGVTYDGIYIYIYIYDQELEIVRYRYIYIYIYIYIARYGSYRACCGWVWHGKRGVVYKYVVGSLNAAEE